MVPTYYLPELFCFSPNTINYALALTPSLIIYEKSKGKKVTQFCSRLVTPGVSEATGMFPTCIFHAF